MTLFQFVVICMWLLFVIFAVDLYQRQKFNLLHFLVFFGGTGAVVVFGIRPDLLDSFGKFFGVASGSDIIVYSSIIVLGYLYFEQIHKSTKQQIETTRLNTAFALRHADEMITSYAKKIGTTTPDASDKSQYLFLIRAYNEATMIGLVIDEIVSAGFTKIAICNDGSSDETVSIIQQKKQHYPEVMLFDLHHLINRGPGAANKTLFAFATKYGKQLWVEWFVTYDADGQMDIHDMAIFMQYADHRSYDVIIWSRFVEGAVVDNMPRLRRMILLWGRVVTRVFNGIRVTDVPTGYRMYHRDVIDKFQLTSDRFSYQNEIIGTISIYHLRYIEIPVHIKYTAYSLSKGQSNMSAFKILKELIYKALFFK